MQQNESQKVRKGVLLPNSGAQYQLLFENNPYPMLVLDKETFAFLTVNSAAIHHNGYSREEFLSMTIKDICPPEKIPEIIEYLTCEHTSSNSISIAVWRHRTKDGALIDVEITKSNVLFNGRESILIVARDITVQKRTEEKLKKYELLFSEIHDLAYCCDTKGNILYVNRIFENLSGRKPEEFIGKSFEPLFEGKDREKATAVYERSIRGEIMQFELRFKDTGTLCEYKNFPIRDEKGVIIGVIGIARDITERKQAEDALNYRINFEKTVAKISTRFAILSDFSNAVSATLADIGLLGDASRAYLFQFRENGKIMDNTHEWCKVGVTPEIQNLQNVPVETAPWWMAHLRADKIIHITDVSQLPIEASAEKQILEMQGIKSLLVLPVYAEKELIGFIGFDNVITTGTWPEENIDLLRITAEILGNAIARKRAMEALRHIAYHCPLTNLPNRMLFHDRLKVSINQAKRSKKAVAVMLLDLDSFKVINDSFGHQKGDLLLKAVTKRLTQCVRGGDTIARMGGDEFMFVLPDILHTQDVCIIVKKILLAIARPFEIEGHVIHTTASMGISLFPLDAHDVENLIKLADVAMYLSKGQGKNTYRFYNLDMNTHV